MNSQLLFGSDCISGFLETDGEIILCFWSDIGEASLAELTLQ